MLKEILSATRTIPFFEGEKCAGSVVMVGEKTGDTLVHRQ